MSSLQPTETAPTTRTSLIVASLAGLVLATTIFRRRSEVNSVQRVIGGSGIRVNNGRPEFPVVENEGILNVRVGTGLSSSGGKEPLLTNDGVLAITAGTGISATSGSNPTISNDGVLAITAGTGLSLTGLSQNPTILNDGVLELTAGTGIAITGTKTNYVITNTSSGLDSELVLDGGTIGLDTPVSLLQGSTFTLPDTVPEGFTKIIVNQNRNVITQLPPINQFYISAQRILAESDNEIYVAGGNNFSGPQYVVVVWNGTTWTTFTAVGQAASLSNCTSIVKYTNSLGEKYILISYGTNGLYLFRPSTNECFRIPIPTWATGSPNVAEMVTVGQTCYLVGTITGVLASNNLRVITNIDSPVSPTAPTVTFNNWPSAGTGTNVGPVTVTTDGVDFIYIGGSFTTLNGVTGNNSILRFQISTSTFSNYGANVPLGGVSFIRFFQNKLIVLGVFTSYNGNTSITNSALFDLGTNTASLIYGNRTSNTSWGFCIGGPGVQTAYISGFFTQFGLYPYIRLVEIDSTQFNDIGLLNIGNTAFNSFDRSGNKLYLGTTITLSNQINNFGTASVVILDLDKRITINTTAGAIAGPYPITKLISAVEGSGITLNFSGGKWNIVSSNGFFTNY